MDGTATADWRVNARATAGTRVDRKGWRVKAVARRRVERIGMVLIWSRKKERE